MTKRRNLLWVMGLNLVAATGCEFGTIQDAEDQLARGPHRELEFMLPVVQDTFVIADVFDSLGVALDTLPGGMMAIVPDTVSFSLFVPFTVPGVSIDTTFTPPPIWSTVDSTMLNLGDFAEVARDASLNTALAALNISNTADAPLELVNYRLGVVDVVGGMLDSVAGQPAFETDGGGTPILVDVVDQSGTVFALGRNETAKIDTLQAAPLVDVLVDKVLNGDTVALVGFGDLHVGDGSVATVNAGEGLDFKVVPIVGLDLTLGPGGASVRLRDFVERGLDRSSELATDLTDNVLDSVGLQFEVVNGVAFRLQVETALVGAQITGDPFADPNAVLDTLPVINAATVDANGRVTAPASDTTTVVLGNQDVGQTLGPFITVGVRVRLLPPAGSRGQIHATDAIEVFVRAFVWAHAGADQ